MATLDDYCQLWGKNEHKSYAEKPYAYEGEMLEFHYYTQIQQMPYEFTKIAPFNKKKTKVSKEWLQYWMPKVQEKNPEASNEEVLGELLKWIIKDKNNPDADIPEGHTTCLSKKPGEAKQTITKILNRL